MEIALRDLALYKGTNVLESDMYSDMYFSVSFNLFLAGWKVKMSDISYFLLIDSSFIDYRIYGNGKYDFTNIE